MSASSTDSSALEQYQERIQEVMFGTSEAIERQIEQLARLKQTEQDLLAQIAQENSDPEAAEEARHKQAIEDLKQEATIDGELNGAMFNRLRQLENQLHEL